MKQEQFRGELRRSMPYGAFDQKRLYQRHLLFGVGGVNLVVALIIILISVFSDKPVESKVFDPTPPDLPGEIVMPTTQITVIPVVPRIAPPPSSRRSDIDAGAFVLLEDSVILADDSTQKDLTTNIGDISIYDWGDKQSGGDSNALQTGGASTGAFPRVDDVIIPDVYPEFVLVVKPDYPNLARRAGLEGTVWVKLLIDKTGTVRDVVIVKDSGANAGFEEAALASAKKCKFSPAIRNGVPIAIWVSFPFEFKLSR